jgi:hypothetical protein
MAEDQYLSRTSGQSCHSEQNPGIERRPRKLGSRQMQRHAMRRRATRHRVIIYLKSFLHLFHRTAIVEIWLSKSQFWISSLESRSSLKRLSTKLKASSHPQRDVCGTSFIGLQTVRIGFYSSCGGIRSRVTPSASGARRNTTNGSVSCIISITHFHTSSTMWVRNHCRPKDQLFEAPKGQPTRSQIIP